MDYFNFFTDLLVGLSSLDVFFYLVTIMLLIFVAHLIWSIAREDS